MKYTWILLVLGIAACQPKTNLEVGDPLPTFDFMMLAGPTETVEIPPGYPLMIIYFDPFCDHCNEFAARISEQEAQWEDMVYYWVSEESEANIQEFIEKYPALKEGYHYFLRDGKYEFDKLFGYSEVPSIFIFDEAHEFVQRY